MGHGLANVARVIDGLYFVGMQAKAVFTELEACQKLAALKIGRRSVSAALKAVVDDWPLFEAVVPPLNPPVSANAANGSDTLNNSCNMSRGAKRVKNSRGRPAQYYQLPSQDVLAAKFGVSAKSSSTVLINLDFSSPKMYRQALHSELIMRRPGHYGRMWLSTRLGISRWTTRRYEKAANIQVQPSYTTQPLSWVNASELPQKAADTEKGVFIEANDGKRYPAIRGLALRLLKKGYALVLKHQQGNFYQARTLGVGIPTPQTALQNTYDEQCPQIALEIAHYGNRAGVGIPTAKPSHAFITEEVKNAAAPKKAMIRESWKTTSDIGVGIPTPPPLEPSFWLCPECLNFHLTSQRPSSCSRCGVLCDWEAVSPLIWRDAQALKQWWMQRYREHKLAKQHRRATPIDQTEEVVVMSEGGKALTEKLHHQIPDLSFANARKIVRQFSNQLIEKALVVVKGRANLRSPAGFLVSFLRSENMLLLNNNKTSKNTEDKRGGSSMEWLRRLAQSEYLSFMSNVDDILNLNFDQPPAALEA
jgi:hypothetical protein